MSTEDLKAGITLQIDQYGYTEVGGDEIRALPYRWLEEQGWSLAQKAGTDTYVVYRPVGRASGATLTPEMFEAARQAVLSRPHEEAMRWAMLQTPFSRDSVAGRIMAEAVRRVDGPNSYGRPPRGLPTFQGTPFRVDDTLGQDEMWMVTQDVAARVENLEQVTNQTATGAMMEAAREREIRRLREWAEGPDFAARPDHYRARPGLCACGFTTAFAGDMQAHIDDTLVQTVDGVPKRWRVCERCQASGLCREVVVSRVPPMSFAYQPLDVPPPTPATERVYRCDNCCRGM